LIIWKDSGAPATLSLPQALIFPDRQSRHSGYLMTIMDIFLRQVPVLLPGYEAGVDGGALGAMVPG
jgi:hypothetical protein